MQDVKPYPLTFEPLIKTKVWGGRALQTALGKALPSEDPVGESWEMVDLPGDQSVVAAGPARGATLEDLVHSWGADLMGQAALDGGRFPLLVKYIDAAQTLSVQVHPDEELGRRLGGRSKSEAWYILEVTPGAAVYHGLVPGVGAAELERALAEGTVERLLERVEVQPGDLVPVPPGTVHAIGAGVLLAEVQQPSDTTYRVYDWGRVGLDGEPRQLHVDQALASVDFERAPPPIVRQGEVELGYFKILLAQLAPGQALELDTPGPRVVVGLEGECVVAAQGHAETPCPRGVSALLPHACRPARVVAQGEARVMTVSFPLAG